MANGGAAAASAPNVERQEVGRVPQTTVGVPSGGPFIRYANTKSVQPAYVNPNLGFGARSQLPISAVSGFLKGFWLKVQASGGTGTVAVYAADAPWNVIQSLAIKDASGQVIYQPFDGFALYLMNLYGGQGAAQGRQDPATWTGTGQSYAAPTTAGNFTFKLWLPLQVNSSGYCSQPADNSAELPRVEIFLNTSTNVYTTPPTTLPTLTLTLEEEFWPVPNNLPDLEPPDAGASAQWFNATPSQNPTAVAMRVLDQSVGQFIHTKIYSFRNVSGVRTDSYPLSDLTQWIDNYQYRVENWDDATDRMFRQFGCIRPVGTLVYTWRDSITEEIDQSDDAERWLVTTGSTKLEIGGTWQLAGQLQVLTGMVFPGPSGWPYGSQNVAAA